MMVMFGYEHSWTMVRSVAMSRLFLIMLFLFSPFLQACDEGGSPVSEVLLANPEPAFRCITYTDFGQNFMHPLAVESADVCTCHDLLCPVEQTALTSVEAGITKALWV